MINSNELRIGNCVTDEWYNTFKNIITAQSINNKGISLQIEDDGNWPELSDHFIVPEYKFEQLHGIPLTEEILEKTGFKYDATENKDKISYWDRLLEDRIFSIGKIEDSFYFIDIVLPETHYKTKLLYLHQLQNLYFALTGEELEINL